MNSKTKIKVNRLGLIESIKARREEAQAEYEKAQAQFEKDVKSYPKRVADALASVARKVRSGELAVDDAFSFGYRLKSTLLPDAPHKPSAPRNLDLAIKQLEIASDHTVLISGEDFAAYMK